MMPTMDPVIRPVAPAEFERVGDLVVDAYAALGDLGPYETVLRDVADRARRAEVAVAIVDGPVAGTVTYVGGPGAYAEVDDPDAAGIRMLAVDPAFRGRGIGEALVGWCVSRAREDQRARVVLHTTDPMTDAQRLYGRLGFDRAPDLDWEPAPGDWLRGYRLALGDPA
jgi:ribosomal protein S18 acetylase RimI-like enzyme